MEAARACAGGVVATHDLSRKSVPACLCVARDLNDIDTLFAKEPTAITFHNATELPLGAQINITRRPPDPFHSVRRQQTQVKPNRLRPTFAHI